MKSRLFFALSICLSLATAGLFPAVAAELPPAGVNFISGQLSFTNTDPDILARLGPPADEGMYRGGSLPEHQHVHVPGCRASARMPVAH